MDPHSRFSQFNTRQLKAGPLPTPARSMEMTTKTTNPLEDYKKRSGQQRNRSSSAPLSIAVSRPIATNSRVKQDEQYHKDMYLAAINNALQQKTRGIGETFDELVDQFSLKQAASDTLVSAAQLRLWIVALSHIVSRLERCHSALVEAVVGMPWTTMDSNCAKSYISFVGMLVSAKPEYLTIVLEKIASGFTYQSGIQALNTGMPETSSSPLTRRVVYERFHCLLQHLLSLVPTLPSALQPLLVRHFPHKRHSQAAQVTYIRNLLRVTEYCPELSDKILATIIDRAIQIDVEIQVELEELEEQAANEQAEVFDLDPFDIIVGQEGESESDDDDSDHGDDFSDLSSDAGEADSDEVFPEEQTDVHHVQDMVNKLDAILKNVFDYFNHSPTKPETPSMFTPAPSSPLSESAPLTPIITRPASPETEEQLKATRRSQFYSLLSIFERTILRTFKSRYTQFLVFWYSSLDPEFSDLFQGMLVSKALLEEDQPAVTRAAAASYIASFVSRALFVDREGARRVMGCLCDFLSNRLDIFNAVTKSGAISPSMAHNSIFYAVAQAVFLIFCFRWRDLQQEEEVEDDLAAMGVPASKWMTELEVLPRVVQSEMNPLKVCSANVVMQFARVAHATDFLYCYSIIEANRRSDFALNPTQRMQTSSRAPAMQAVLLGASMHSELNTFFPFDPYRLPRSSSYIESVYREWSAVAIDDGEDEDEEDEDEAGAVEEHEISGEEALPAANAIPMKSRETGEADSLNVSFGGMSISPAPLPLSVSVSMSVA